MRRGRRRRLVIGGLMLLVVLAVAVFAAAAWGVSLLLGLAGERGITAIGSEEERAPARGPVPQAVQAFAPGAVRSPL